jgi:hypothetical protein
MALFLQIVQERQNSVRRDRIQIQLYRIAVSGRRDETQKQNHGIPVTEHGMPAHTALFSEILAEEGSH